jgi:hypothetical protein
MTVHSAGSVLRFPALAVGPEVELARPLRILFREGYDDHLSGYVTGKQPDGTFLVSPWSAGLTNERPAAPAPRGVRSVARPRPPRRCRNTP